MTFHRSFYISVASGGLPAGKKPHLRVYPDRI
jgi:hypothetical protein